VRDCVKNLLLYTFSGPYKSVHIHRLHTLCAVSLPLCSLCGLSSLPGPGPMPCSPPEASMPMAPAPGGGTRASCGDQGRHAEDMQDAFELRDQHGETPFASSLCPASGQKVPMLHPPFHRPTGMGHQALPRCDLLGLCRDSWLPRLPHGLVPPSSPPAICLLPATLGFAGARWTRGGRVIAQVSPVCDGCKATRHLLVPRAARTIFGRVREEIFLAQEASCTLGRGVGLRERRDHPRL
jgi:hypothetical protein